MPPLVPASPLTSTAAVVRELLLAAGGAPQRMSQLYAAANAAVGPLSRTHFREAVVAGMFARGELRKQRVVPAAAAAASANAAGGAAAAASSSSSSSSSSAAELRPFFGITLAPSAKARALVREARAPGGKLAATLAAVAAARARAVPAPAAAAVAAVAGKAAAAAPAAAAAALR